MPSGFIQRQIWSLVIPSTMKCFAGGRTDRHNELVLARSSYIPADSLTQPDGPIVPKTGTNGLQCKLTDGAVGSHQRITRKKTFVNSLTSLGVFCREFHRL